MNSSNRKAIWERFAGVSRSDLECMVLVLEHERDELRHALALMREAGGALVVAADTLSFERGRDRAADLVLKTDPTSAALRIIAGRIRMLKP